jgi:VWFA-related protein
MGCRQLAAISLLATGSWQLAAAGAPQQPPQTFRSGTQVVQVDVRVLKNGRFVTDLGAGDFTIKEDGVAQKVESVVLIGAPSAPAPSAPPAPPAPPASSAPSAPPAVWVFVFDTDHLSPGGLNRSRDAIVKFIGDRFHEGDIGGVLADGKMANNRLTSSREELKAAAAGVKVPGDMRSRQLERREWPRLQDDDEVWRIATGDRESLQNAVVRACSEDPDQCKRVSPDVQILEKARTLNSQAQVASLKTLKAAEALSSGLARIPGAKTVVFLSEGFFLTDKQAELRQAVGMAARAGAHFYTIDARGLNRGAAGSDIIDQPVVNSPLVTTRFDTQANGMNSLAVDTGGFAIRNENNFARALDEIQRDAGTYYVVSYTPSNAVFDGKYRTIDVVVDRPGVKVRARRGYLATAPALLLRSSSPASAPSAARVPPKDASESERAKANSPTLPVSPGLVALPDEAAIEDSTAFVTNAATSRTDAVRARVDGGKMTAALGRVSGATSGAAAAGWSAYEKGDVETAALRLGEAAKAPDARPWVHYALGLAEFAQRRYKDAATAWERVMRDAPEFEPIYFSLADAYGLQRDEGAALKVLREAQRRWPSDPEVFDAIGVIQVKRGALDAAVESFTTATKVAPREALGWFNLGRALQMRWVKFQRYDRQREAWVGPDDDRKAAATAFQKYLELGGPFEAQARQALAALAWK